MADVAAAVCPRSTTQKRPRLRRASPAEGRDVVHACDVVHRVPLLAWAVWRVVRQRDWSFGAILVATARDTSVVRDIDRQMYFFYRNDGTVLVLGHRDDSGDIPA